jgi:hypothetical protein
MTRIRGKRAREVCSDINSIRKVQAENNPLVFVGRPSAFAFLKFLLQVIASEDAAEHTSYPRLRHG